MMNEKGKKLWSDFEPGVKSVSEPTGQKTNIKEPIETKPIAVTEREKDSRGAENVRGVKIYPKAAILTCIDPRLHLRPDGTHTVGQLIKELNSDCFLVTRAGSVRDLVRPTISQAKESLIRDLRVAVEEVGAKIIALLTHENCKAYADKNFKNREEELFWLKQDVGDAVILLRGLFPGVEIESYIAELRPGTKDVFDVKKI